MTFKETPERERERMRGTATSGENDTGNEFYECEEREPKALLEFPGDLLIQTGSRREAARDNTQSRRDEGRSTINDHYNYGNAR